MLTRILNKVRVFKETMVNQLDRMDNHIFEVNAVTFANNEFPTKGARQNMDLHLMVKCVGHYIKSVMIYGGLGVDIFHLYMLKILKIDTNKI